MRLHKRVDRRKWGGREQIQERPGFALIIAISLMAFILLLLLSLTALVSVETNASTKSLERANAQANARFAAIQALGSLYKWAGNDQVATAQSDLTSPAIAHNARWTGVWWDPSTMATDPIRGVQAPPVWLVSDPTIDPNLFNSTGLLNGAGDYVNAAAKEDNVILLGPGSIDVSTGDTDVIILPKSSIEKDATIVGKYAWWVGDESVKAKVKLSDTLAGVGTNESRLRRFGIHTIQDISWMNFPNFSGFHGVNTDSMLTRSGLQYQVSSLTETDIKQAYHHLSLHGHGVLSDAQNGGLRQDLTYAFEVPAIFAHSAGGIDLIDPSDLYTLSSKTGVNGQDGNDPSPPKPDFETLRDYYLLKDNAQVQAGTLNEPIYYHHRVLDSSVTTPNNPIMPYISCLHFSFSLRAENVGTGAARIYLILKPYVVVYNPHNVAITIPMPTGQSLQYQPHLNFDVTVSVDGVPYANDLIGWKNETFWHLWDCRDSVVIRPGEALAFGRSTGVEPLIQTWGTWNQFHANMDLDGYFELDITDRNSSLRTDIQNGASDLTIEVGMPDSSFVSASSAQNYVLLYDGNPAAGEFLGNFKHAISSIAPAPTASLTQSIADWNGPVVGQEGVAAIIRLRGYEESGASTVPATRALIDGNFRSPYFDVEIEGFGTSTSGYFSSPYTAYITNDPTEYNLDTHVATGPPRNVVIAKQFPQALEESIPLFDVPREPLHAIAQLQHASVSYLGHQPAYPIGNSYASTRIPQDQVTRVVGSERYADISHIANDSLYDHFYFSTIDTGLDAAGFANWQNGTIPQQNHRLIPYELDEMPVDLTDFSDAQTDTAVYDAMLGKVMLDGPFNINSTSVEAWVAFLSGSRDLDIPLFDPANPSSLTFDSSYTATPVVDREVIYSRFTRPISEDWMMGYRRLENAEIRALATQIVAEIKKRGASGPALSLSDFINRSLVNDDDTGRHGVLQAALDQTVNVPISGGGIFVETGTVDPAADLGVASMFNNADAPQSAGFPGYLLQADLLQKLDPLMTSRSDTFVIRAYGESVNPVTEELSAKSYCEMLVQRVPDPYMSSGGVYTNVELATPPSPIGRKYKIINFRWLSPDDV